MAAGMNMSLEEIMERAAVARRGRSYGPGPDRRVPRHNTARTAPYSIPQLQGRQVLEGSMVSEEGAASGTQSGTKLYVSNLDYGVSNEDIKLLFSEEGELKRYSIHYDKSGRSKGTAEVVFVKHSDALKAIKKYNNMRLDGKPLQIELVGSSMVTPADVPLHHDSLYGIYGRPDGVPLSELGWVGGGWFHSGFARGRFPSGFARGRFPRGRGEEKEHIRKVSVRDLDRDLERYHRLPKGQSKPKRHIQNQKVSAKDLDDDLERYRLEAIQIKKEKGSELKTHG